jgi:hypothetical protein
MDPGPFLLHCYYCFTFTRIIYILAYYYLLPLDKLNPLFTTNRWDWQPHRKLGQSTWMCCVQVPHCCWWRSFHVNYAPAFFWRRCLECHEASKHQPSEVWLSPIGSINLRFTTERNLLLCSSYLPLGVPNWVPTTHHHLCLWWISRPVNCLSRYMLPTSNSSP